MRSSSKKSRPILALMCCGSFLTAFCIGGPAPAAAFGGFGHMGGFGRPATGMGGGSRAHMTAPRHGAGRYVNRPSGGGNRVTTGPDGGRVPGHHRITGGGDRNPGSRGLEPPKGGGRNTVSLPGPGGDSGGGGVGIGPNPGPGFGGNNGGSGVPPRGERRFVPNEVITAFSSSATPQSIDQIGRRYNLTRLEFAKLRAGRQHLLPLAGRWPSSARGRDRRDRERTRRGRCTAQLHFHAAGRGCQGCFANTRATSLNTSLSNCKSNKRIRLPPAKIFRSP